MNTEHLTLHQIRTIGMEALLRELGPVGMIRFIQQYETGSGDYTHERRKGLPKRSVREVGAEIVTERQKKAG
jgi:hypothetical protein